jgi:hypothetical protein
LTELLNRLIHRKSETAPVHDPYKERWLAHLTEVEEEFRRLRLAA